MTAAISSGFAIRFNGVAADMAALRSGGDRRDQDQRGGEEDEGREHAHEGFSWSERGVGRPATEHALSGADLDALGERGPKRRQDLGGRWVKSRTFSVSRNPTVR